MFRIYLTRGRIAHHVGSSELPDWHRLVRSREVDPRKIETCDLGLEASVKQDVGRVDVVVYDGVVTSMVQAAEPLGGANGDGPPCRPA